MASRSDPSRTRAYIGLRGSLGPAQSPARFRGQMRPLAQYEFRFCSGLSRTVGPRSERSCVRRSARRCGRARWSVDAGVCSAPVLGLPTVPPRPPTVPCRRGCLSSRIRGASPRWDRLRRARSDSRSPAGRSSRWFRRSFPAVPPDLPAGSNGAAPARVASSDEICGPRIAGSYRRNRKLAIRVYVLRAILSTATRAEARQRDTRRDQAPPSSRRHARALVSRGSYHTVIANLCVGPTTGDWALEPGNREHPYRAVTSQEIASVRFLGVRDPRSVD